MASVSAALKFAEVSDDDLRQLQREIMSGKGKTIPETGGYRKIRCAAGRHGKSGGVRVIFADYPRTGKCVLVAAYSKNVKGNLSKVERNRLRKVKAELDKRFGI